MKHLLHLLIILSITTSLYAQAPQKMTYQAVLRDASSTLIQNKSVSIRISILQGTPTGNSVYAETHTATTNANGLVTLEVGGGSAQSTAFSTIDWSKGPYFIKTEVDPTGGNSYTISGSSQLLSVPYALYAQTSGSGSSSSATTIVDNLTSTSATSALSANQGKVLKDLIDAAKTAPGSSSSSLTGDVSSTGATTKLDKIQGNILMATTPLAGQALRFNGLYWAPTTESLTGDVTGTYAANKVTQIQSIPIAPTAPANGQIFKYNGASWIPEYPYAYNVQLMPQIPGLYASTVQDALYQLKQQITVAAGGGITSVAHDNTMSGSGDTGSPLGLADGAVTSAKLADKAVGLSKLADISPNTLLGRSTSGNGSLEAITIGSGLTLSGGVLSASGTGTGGGTTGTITGITVGSGLTGGGTSGNINIGLDASSLKSTLLLSNVDNTSDKLKPVSDATQTALNLKEDKANKSTDATLSSNSDTKYPSEKAVKTYVDNKISSGGGITSINATNGIISAGTSGTVTIGLGSIDPNTILGNNTTGKTAPFAINASTLKSMINITKADIGLGNVENTKDADKVMSTATKAYIDALFPTYNASTDANKVLTVNSTGTGVIWATAPSGGGSGTGSVTGVSVVTANGFQGSASSGAVPNITLGTTVTGLLKGNGTTGAVTAATAGTDYLIPSMTANKLLGSGLSGTTATEITLGTNLSFTGNTLNATGGSPATTSALGTIQLAGDLGGTATAPTIANNAVTYAKMQAMTANKLLGSGQSGTSVSEIILGNGLSFIGNTLNSSIPTSTTTDANKVLTVNASGVPVWLAPSGAGGSGTVTGVTVATENGFKGNATAGTVPDIHLATTVTGLLKGDATSGTITAATAGTDYLVPAMTANKLLGSGLSGTKAAEITLGTNLSFTGNTLNATGGSPATTLALGTIQLAGDLGGTATAPTVPGLSGKAPLASPTFTGTPTAPTAAAGTNTTQIATTAFVLANAGGTPATTSALGTVQLAGDLGGTATAPTIANNAVTTAKIASNAVTYAKMQAMTANKLLGSGASGTAVSEITLGSGLSFTLNTLNSVAPTPAAADAGKVLTANASGSATWQTASGGSGVSTASNGLTVTTNDVALGGALTKNTIIDQGANTLTFTNTGLSGSAGKTIVNGSFKTTGAVYAKVRPHSLTSNIDWQPDDYIVICTAVIPVNILSFPDPSANIGRILCIRNVSGATLTPNKVPDNGTLWPFNTGNLANGAGIMVISDGTAWHNFAK
jgi:hypothetical protein